VELVYDPRGLSGVMTARPEVAEVLQCNSTEFTRTQLIILDKTEHSTTSLPSDAKVAGNSFFILTQ
jgi:hypothetical protein